MADFHKIDPVTLKELLDKGEAVVIDVRDPDEFRSENIEGAKSHPLTDLCSAPESLDASGPKKIVVCCLSGMRSLTACQSLKEHHKDLYLLDGGITAWKKFNFPTVKTGKKIMPMFQQIQIVSGTMVLTSLLLAITVSSWFLALNCIIGVMQIYSGISGWCGMSGVLIKMPWNRG